MVKGKSLPIGAGILVGIVVLLIFGMDNFEVEALSRGPDQTPSVIYRPDIIDFDMLKDVYKKFDKLRLYPYIQIKLRKKRS